MDDPITIGGTLLCIVVVAGMLAAAYGFLETMAGGMSSAPDDELGRRGCITFAIGAAIVIGSILWAVLG